MSSKAASIGLAALLAIAAIPAFVLAGTRGWGIVVMLATLHATLTLTLAAPGRATRAAIAIDLLAAAAPLAFIVVANALALAGFAHAWIFAD